jgi:hypothetical protein
MVAVLDTLNPLAALVRQAAEPMTLAERLVELASSGATGQHIVSALWTRVTDHNLVIPALVRAGVLDATGSTAHDAYLRLAQAQVLVAAAEDDWELVLTVPGFLRSVGFDAHSSV